MRWPPTNREGALVGGSSAGRHGHSPVERAQQAGEGRDGLALYATAGRHDCRGSFGKGRAGQGAPWLLVAMDGGWMYWPRALVTGEAARRHLSAWPGLASHKGVAATARREARPHDALNHGG